MNKTLKTFLLAGVSVAFSTAVFGRDIEIAASNVAVKGVRFGQNIEQLKAELKKNFTSVECRSPTECKASNDKAGATDKMWIELGEVGTVWKVRYSGNFQVAQNEKECQKIAITTHADFYKSNGQVLGKPINRNDIHRKNDGNNYFDFAPDNNTVATKFIIGKRAQFQQLVSCDNRGMMDVSMEAISDEEKERRGAVKTTDRPKF